MLGVVGNRYEIVGNLGPGTAGVGKVKVARDLQDDTLVAVKIAERSGDGNEEDIIEHGVRALQALDSPYVLRVLDVLRDDERTCIVSEYLPNGELFEIIADAGALDEASARVYFREIMEGLDHCHRSGVCHRDIKPENILVDEDGHLKLAGFSCAVMREAGEDPTACVSPSPPVPRPSDRSTAFVGGSGECPLPRRATTNLGTVQYAAPEVFMQETHNGFVADVWSCGVVLFVMLAGYLPFTGDTDEDAMRAVVKGEFTVPDNVSPEAAELLSHMLCVNPENRWPIAQIMASPWYNADDGDAALLVDEE